MIDPAKLVIRHTEPDDAEALCAIYSEEAAYHTSLHLPYQTLASWHAKLKDTSASGYSLVAVLDGEVVGHAVLEVGDGPRRRHSARLSLMVAYFSRRIGVGSALVQAAIDLSEKWLAVSRLELAAYTDNAAALALAEKFAFKHEGTAQRYAFRNGEFADAAFLARLSPAA